MPTFSFGKRYISLTRLPKLAQSQLLHTHHSILPDHCVVTPIVKVDLLEVDFTYFFWHGKDEWGSKVDLCQDAGVTHIFGGHGGVLGAASLLQTNLPTDLM